MATKKTIKQATTMDTAEFVCQNVNKIDSVSLKWKTIPMCSDPVDDVRPAAAEGAT